MESMVRPAYRIVQVPPGDLCLLLCFPFRNACLPLESKRTYCFQKISRKTNSASGRNGISSAFSYFHISRDHGTHILKEIPSLNKDDYIKALILYSSLCSYGNNNRNAFRHCCTYNSIFKRQTFRLSNQETPYPLHFFSCQVRSNGKIQKRWVLSILCNNFPASVLPGISLKAPQGVLQIFLE